MSNYKYKFSVISAVYNVSEFLVEAIESILNQTIGLKNIQFILVDDGTPDNSGKICDEYAAKYPDNIFVIHKENGGVSSARNEGLKHVQGKYVNFMDSDDKWANDAFAKVWKFFEEHYDETDMVALPIKFFDAAKGDHMLNYKFEQGSRIVDLVSEWDAPQMHVASSFFKAELFNNICFDTTLAYAEDAKVVQDVIRQKQTLGLFDGSAYLYRKRSTGAASAIQTSGQKPNWYLPVVKGFHLDVIEKSIEAFGVVPKYVQLVLMYDLQWRIRQRNFLEIVTLTEEEKQEYLILIKKILGYIDEDIILFQKNLDRYQRFVTFELKKGSALDVVLDEKDAFCVFSDDVKFSLANSVVNIEFLTIKEGIVKIEGCLDVYNMPFDELDVSFWVNNQRVEVELTERKSNLIYLNRNVLKKIGFSTEFKLDSSTDNYKFRLGAIINGKLIFFQKYGYGYFCPITCDYRYSHFVKGDWMATAAKNHITLEHCDSSKRKTTELKFLLWLLKNNKAKTRSQVLLRAWYNLRKKAYKKPIWLVSDRPNVAGDNGEAFFKYMVAEHPEIDTRYVINKKSPDFNRIKQIGPVIKRLSLKHKLYILLSEYIFSSQGENEHFDPFGKKRNAFRDILATKRFVFLQHGVIINDLSSWLFKQNKNIFGFVTTAKEEYNSILQNSYGYTADRVWLTGLPRFDLLYDDSQKIISIMPSWRKYLTDGNDPVTREWKIAENFTESEYYLFYNALINNHNLLDVAKKEGYKIEFLLHPNLRAAAEFFNANDVVSIVTTDIDYNKSFAISDMIVTDYSSTVFDFSYLCKPIVYSQFDFNDFFSGSHSVNKGYFDYERDGFGEVEYDLESTISRIIEYMENGCKLKDKYRERIERFFAFNDKNNSKRIYEKAIEYRKS